MANISRHNSMVFCVALTLLLVLAAEAVVTLSLGYFEPQMMVDYGLAVILAAGGTTAFLAFPTLLVLMKMTRRIDLMRQQLVQAVRTDYLTGTLSRAAFMEMFERHQTRAKRQLENGGAQPCCDALLVIDADHFKKINDRFGHAVGDAVLTMMGRVLHTTVRPGDHVGRLGGEEFGVYLTGCDASAARFVAERLRLAISKAAEDLGIQGLRVTVSVGAVVFEPACDFARVFEKADAELYNAKDAGRDKVILDDAVPLAA
ncbi:MAG: GGDEF domain-containing protein [Pseudomonadota bacterium]